MRFINEVVAHAKGALRDSCLLWCLLSVLVALVNSPYAALGGSLILIAYIFVRIQEPGQLPETHVGAHEGLDEDSIRRLIRLGVSENFAGWQGAVKRTLDVVLASIIIFGVFPVALIWLMVALPTRGPVIYRAGYTGRYGKRISVLRFRTFRVGEHRTDLESHIFGGMWMHRTGFYRSPALISVLKGDLSLIGPNLKPFWDFEGALQKVDISRLSVRPGILGAATLMSRLRYKRGWTTFDDLLDLYYIGNWSLALDWKLFRVWLKNTGSGGGPSASEEFFADEPRQRGKDHKTAH